MRAKLGIALLIVFTLLAAACGDDADSGDDDGGAVAKAGRWPPSTSTLCWLRTAPTARRPRATPS